MQTLLVIGGAGYIGSHMVASLLAENYQVITLDNLSTGFMAATKFGGEFIHGNFGDSQLLDSIFTRYPIDGVMHFAAASKVGESVVDPAKYYHNNVANTIVLLDSMRKHQINSFIFSSTAAIFGNPKQLPIPAEADKQPLNPYGRSKWMIEQLLADYDAAYGLKSLCLRYFNAAGADPQIRLGKRHNPETHLIPILLQVASGRRAGAKLFGDNYDTPDGTCIRDYIHVSDLCDAHLKAWQYLCIKQQSHAFNLGNGHGFSVAEVIAAVQQVTGKTLTIETVPPRAGDPACLVADASDAAQTLGWQPRYADLTTIIQHAWQWEQRC